MRRTMRRTTRRTMTKIMTRIMNGTWLVALGLATATPAAAQMASQAQAETVAAIERLDMMVGEWEGTSTARLGPGREEMSEVEEKAGYRAGGELLVVEGRGIQETDGEPRVVHDAFGVISWNAETGTYRMRAYRAGQGWVDSDVVLDGKTLKWGMETPGGAIRFRADFSVPNHWTETGEIQRQGQWVEFLRMELDRVR